MSHAYAWVGQMRASACLRLILDHAQLGNCQIRTYSSNATQRNALAKYLYSKFVALFFKRSAAINGNQQKYICDCRFGIKSGSEKNRDCFKEILNRCFEQALNDGTKTFGWHFVFGYTHILLLFWLHTKSSIYVYICRMDGLRFNLNYHHNEMTEETNICLLYIRPYMIFEPFIGIILKF